MTKPMTSETFRTGAGGPVRRAFGCSWATRSPRR